MRDFLVILFLCFVVHYAFTQEEHSYKDYKNHLSDIKANLGVPVQKAH
jgi:hypothetical protein